MQQAHSVQAAVPVTRAVLFLAHVHLTNVETMTRQGSLRKKCVASCGGNHPSKAGIVKPYLIYFYAFYFQ